MDRKITAQKHSKIIMLKSFEYLDIIPYSIALLLLSGSIYIVNAFIAITNAMK